MRRKFYIVDYTVDSEGDSRETTVSVEPSSISMFGRRFLVDDVEELVRSAKEMRDAVHSKEE